AHDHSRDNAGTRRARTSWRAWAATAAALVVGIAIGIRLGEENSSTGVPVAADARPRAPLGEARLLMDQRFEEFGLRLNTRERNKAGPPSSSPPAATRAPAAREASASEEG
ncbi:MAG: hypothetical protein ACXWCS_13315, partial [Burkholderiales bacterium]